MKPRNRKIYALALFSRIQGTTIRVCTVEAWFSSTRKRDAQAAANRYNRKHYWNQERREFHPDKWAAVETL